jgi:hypothetical protein
MMRCSLLAYTWNTHDIMDALHINTKIQKNTGAEEEKNPMQGLAGLCAYMCP